MDEAPDHAQHLSVSLPSSTTSINTSSSSSSAVTHLQGDESNHHQQQHHQQQQEPSYRVNILISAVASTEMRADLWSCFVVVVTFWLFAASMMLVLWFYGSENLQLGPNCSRLIQANSFFVKSIKVQETDQLKPGPMLYGFYEPPPLDVEISWTETHNAFIPVNFHKEWIHFLNEGSKVDVSYRVKSSSPLSLVITQGKESLVSWIEDPSYSSTALSWKIIYGSGRIQQEIPKSSNYYIAVGNLNSEEVEGTPDDDWYVKLFSGPRWIIYFVGTGVVIAFVLLVFRFCNTVQTTSRNGTGFQAGEVGSEGAPLLSPKDDDLSSLGSCCDSIADDEEDLQEWLAVSALDGNSSKEGENNNNPQRLCVVCFDAPRDCFFLPCGHCAACFTCGTRIAEDAGTCPICHRKMKKMRKIFTV